MANYEIRIHNDYQPIRHGDIDFAVFATLDLARAEVRSLLGRSLVEDEQDDGVIRFYAPEEGETERETIARVYAEETDCLAEIWRTDAPTSDERSRSANERLLDEPSSERTERLRAEAERASTVEIRGTVDGQERVYLLEHNYRAKNNEHPLSIGYGVHPDEPGEYDLYDVVEVREGFRQMNTTALVWFADLRRGAVDSGGEPTWSDADSPADLAHRVLISGEVNP